MPGRAELEAAAAFADVPMEIEIELDRRKMRLREILELDAGSIISMTKSAGDYLDIYVAGAAVARGEVVVLEKNIGVRITTFESRT
ncbi:MAG TPA: FliM/FliN family flagellar motor switch protein [Bryobacteraceae bacterium]|nr:FliM/FliN family flagellar motor switch protein [Bryobacteraceae bacterium]